MPVAGTPFLAQRLVIFFGSCWLLTSWILVIGLRRPLLPTTETWLPGIRLMLVMAAVGLVIVWPMAAMSSTRSQPAGRTFRETCILLVTAQLIIWPAGLVTSWSLERTILIALTLTGWGFLAGAVAAWGRCRVSAGRRLCMMSLCLLIALISPIIMLWFENPMLERISPLSSMWTMVSAKMSPVSADWIVTGSIWLVALLAWGLAAGFGSCDEPLQKRTSGT